MDLFLTLYAWQSVWNTGNCNYMHTLMCSQCVSPHTTLFICKLWSRTTNTGVDIIAIKELEYILMLRPTTFMWSHIYALVWWHNYLKLTFIIFYIHLCNYLFPTCIKELATSWIHSVLNVVNILSTKKTYPLIIHRFNAPGLCNIWLQMYS